MRVSTSVRRHTSEPSNPLPSPARTHTGLPSQHTREHAVRRTVGAHTNTHTHTLVLSHTHTFLLLLPPSCVCVRRARFVSRPTITLLTDRTRPNSFPTIELVASSRPTRYFILFNCYTRSYFKYRSLIFITISFLKILSVFFSVPAVSFTRRYFLS